jgi:uncharacterized membrane-anchored protein YhcB (DUF1043 family)
MKRNHLTVAVYILLVFFGGVAVGAFGFRLYTASSVTATTNQKTPEDYRRAYMSEMRQRLSLTDSQAVEVEKVLDATRDRYRELRARTRPEMEKILADQTAAVRLILNDQQMSEYDKMRAEREARRKRGLPPGAR